MMTGFRGESVDHVHQRSAWFTHGDVVVEGVEPRTKQKGVAGFDFWTETGGPRGRIVACEISAPVADGDRVRWTARNEWRTPDGQAILQEDCTISVVDGGDARLIVYQTRLRPVAGAVSFADTKEGAFGVRVHDSLKVSGGKKSPGNPTSRIRLSTGAEGEAQCWGRKADWCDYSGRIDGRDVGLAIFDHPANPVRACWHVRGYGLMAANPFGRARSGFPDAGGDLVRLQPGETLKLCYAILAHVGDATSGRVAEHFAAFVERFMP